MALVHRPSCQANLANATDPSKMPSDLASQAVEWANAEFPAFRARLDSSTNTMSALRFMASPLVAVISARSEAVEPGGCWLVEGSTAASEVGVHAPGVRAGPFPFPAKGESSMTNRNYNGNGWMNGWMGDGMWMYGNKGG